MNNKVLLGMSGGVDSSVSALLLQKMGYQVVGITFLFTDIEKTNQETIESSKSFSEKLGIKHILVDYKKEFRESVVKNFIDEYQKGKTPFPCAYCNPKVKFKLLEKYANIENCAFIATGHYAAIREVDGVKYIFEGVDKDKDQSFFLWGLKSSLIQKLIFPLGDFSKKEIRLIANNNGFKKLSEK